MSSVHLLKNTHTLVSRPAKATFPLGANISVLSGPKFELRSPLLLHRYLDNLIDGRGQDERNVSADIGRLIALTTRTVDGKTLTEYTFAQLQYLATEVAQGFNELLPKTHDGGGGGTGGTAARRHPTERDDVPFVVFCARKSPQLCMAILGALKTGCAYVPVDYDWPDERLRYILNDARPSIVVYDDACKYVDVLEQYCKEQRISAPVMLGNLFKRNRNSPAYDSQSANNNVDLIDYSAQVQEHHTAVILYTSGTTGHPKGCKLPHRGLMNALQFRMRRFPHYPDEEGLLKTVMTFSDSVLEMFETWFSLRPLVVVTKEALLDVSWFLRFLEANDRIYRIFVVPSLLNAMIEVLHSDRRTFAGGLKMLSTGGEPLSTWLAEAFFEKFPHVKLANYYGQTECCADLTYEIWDNVDAFRGSLSSADLISIGRPIDNLTVYILDANLRPVGAGQVGELFVSGPSVCTSYIGGATLGKFLPNHLIENSQQNQKNAGHSVLLKTGDLAVYNPDNKKHVIYLVGRSDDMVKIAGQKVHLTEVLKVVQSLPNIAECAVISLVRTGDIKIIAFVRFSTPTSSTRSKSLTAAETEESMLRTSREALSRKLPNYAMPRLIPYRDKLPRTVSGKIAKQALIDYYRTNYETFSQNSNETALGLLATSIGVVEADIDVDKSFVENGGSSLRILAAVLALQKAGFQIELQQFLTAKTVQDILHVCRRSPETGSSRTTESCDVQSKLPSPKQVPTCSFKVIKKPISELNRDEVINVVAESFGTYSDLAIFGESGTEDEREAYEHDYPYFLKDGLSFGLVRESDNRVVAVSWGTDFETEIPLVLNGSAATYGKDIYELLDIVDKSMAPYLPKGRGLLTSKSGSDADFYKILGKKRFPHEHCTGKVWHGRMAGILPSVGVNDKVALMYTLIDSEIHMAKELGFECIVAESASPMVQQLVHDFVHHEAYVKIRPRDFVASDGRMPFANYPEDYYLYGDVLWLNGHSRSDADGDEENRPIRKPFELQKPVN